MFVDQRWSRPAIWPALLILFVAATAAAQTQNTTRQVLLLHSSAREYQLLDAFTAIFRTELARQCAAPVNFVELPLQPAGAAIGGVAATVDYVRSAFGDRPPDLIVPIGGPAAVFAQDTRQQLFPATPMLLAASDQRFVDDARFTSNDAAVAVANDPSAIIGEILRLLPDTRTVFVVVGSSAREQFWRREMARQFLRFHDRLTFIWPNELSFEQILERTAALPPRSAIFYALMAVDAAGIPQSEERVLADLHRVANAPIFGMHSTQIGRGVVGGPVTAVDELGRYTAKVASRILHGESPSALRMALQPPGPPTFDWRELRRWGIDADRLAPGSVVRFRAPTEWDRHKWPIIGGVSFSLLQALLVVGLLVNRGRRRRAEQSLRSSEERFRLLADSAPAMIWMMGPERECTAVNRSWLDFTGRPADAESGSGWAESVHPDDRARCRAACGRAFDRHEPFRMEYRMRRRDGEYRWILGTAVPRFTSGGAFAGYIGSAIDVTELRQAKEALSGLSRRLMAAQEEERDAVAHALREGLCQRLVLLTLHLRTSTRLLLANGEGGDGYVEELCSQLSDLGREIEGISRQLSSSKLELLGLPAAARSLCEEVSARDAVEIDITEAGVPHDVPKDVALVLFRVLQEALANAVKHSGVREFGVSLRGSADQVQLEVADEGSGFEPERAMAGGGAGLIGMRERLSAIDGTLSIESRPGAGTRVRACVPRGGHESAAEPDFDVASGADTRRRARAPDREAASEGAER